MLFKQNEKILFIGDSVTDDGRARPVGDGFIDALGNGYVQLINTLFAVEYPELKLNFVNMGVSGNTSSELLARWDTDAVALDPDWTVVLIGINDIWRQFDQPEKPDRAVFPEEYEKNLQSIADKTKSKLIFMCPYFMETNKADAMRELTDRYAEICCNVAKKNNIPCIELQPAFDELLKHYHPSFISWDRVHPGKYGSYVIAKAFLKFVGFQLNI